MTETRKKAFFESADMEPPNLEIDDVDSGYIKMNVTSR